jgi:hypothetical protein
MLQELHAPIAIGTTNRISSQQIYSLMAIGVTLLFLGILVVAASMFIAYPPDPSSFAMDSLP